MWIIYPQDKTNSDTYGKKAVIFGKSSREPGFGVVQIKTVLVETEEIRYAIEFWKK